MHVLRMFVRTAAIPWVQSNGMQRVPAPQAALSAPLLVRARISLLLLAQKASPSTETRHGSRRGGTG